MKRHKLMMAAVAGLAVGATTPAGNALAQKPDEVKCYGINSCGSHSKCGVAEDDLAAMKKLLGDKEYEERFGKSQVHSCGSHAKCGASSHILNWTPTSAGDCKDKAGFLIEKVDGKKVAKKA
jgi:hypothetical protein